jgi:hypothetical protein
VELTGGDGADVDVPAAELLFLFRGEDIIIEQMFYVNAFLTDFRKYLTFAFAVAML